MTPDFHFSSGTASRFFSFLVCGFPLSPFFFDGFAVGVFIQEEPEFALLKSSLIDRVDTGNHPL